MLPFRRPHSALCARRDEVTSGEPRSGRGLVEFPESRRRDVFVSLMGTKKGFLGKGGETEGRHLASREQPLLPGRHRMEAALFCGTGFSEAEPETWVVAGRILGNGSVNSPRWRVWVAAPCLVSNCWLLEKSPAWMV